MLAKTKPEYATFWQRLMAFLLDFIIIVVPVFVVVSNIVALVMVSDLTEEPTTPEQKFNLLYDMYSNLIFALIGIFGATSFVLALIASTRWQATPGKRLAGIYISNADGSKPKFGSLFGRFITLPLAVTLIQIFERNATYEKLEQIKASGKYVTNVRDLQAQMMTPVSEITGLLVFVLVFFWFLRIFFRSDKAAFHDTLFNTRVYQGKK